MWTQSLPIWVSRKTADGLTSSYSVPLWMFMLIGLITMFNLLLWGVIGLYEAVEVIARIV